MFVSTVAEVFRVHLLWVATYSPLGSSNPKSPMDTMEAKTLSDRPRPKLVDMWKRGDLARWSPRFNVSMCPN